MLSCKQLPRIPLAALSLSLLLGSRPAAAELVHVTNTTANVVSAIDTGTNAVLGTIPVGLSPARVAVTPDGARAYVTNTAADSVSVIHTGTSTVVATVPVANAPSAVAVTSDGAEVYVAAAGGVLQVLDAALIGTASDPVIATLSFGASSQTATSIAVLPDGTRAYAVVSRSLRVIDTSTHTVLRSVYVGTSPSRVAISPDGTRAYVTNSFGFDTFGFDGQLVVVDTGTDAVLSTIPLVGLPASLAVTPDGARAYVAIVSRFLSGGIAGGFVPASTITVIDLAASVVSGSIPLPGTPAGVAVTADGSRVYVAVPGTSSLAVIDTTTDTLVTTIGVAAGPSDVAIVPAPLLPGCEDGAPCDDDNACTTGDACLGSFCVGGPPPDCNDDDVCTDDSCNPAFGCVHTHNTAPCDDGNACTMGDTCAGGACIGSPDCDDNDVCTDDACDPASGCINTPNTAPCDDGNACTTGDTCAAGACVGGPPLDCDDDDVCTDDACDPAWGCINVTASCDDGNACTTNDACVGGGCVGGPALDCKDGNVCTDDACDPAWGCVNTPNTAPCDDGNVCTTGDVCVDGTCTGTGDPDCEDRPNAYVTNTTTHVISMIDTATDMVLGTIPVGLSPARVAVTRDGARVYVTNTAADSVSVIHAGRSLATVPVADAPFAVAVTPDGAEVYVVAAGGVLQVLETALMGTASDPVIATLSFGATAQTATSVAILPDGTRAYALVSGSLRVIDAATHTVLRSIYVGTSPSRVAISPDGTRAYVTNSFGFDTFGFDGQLVVVDTGTDSVLRTIPLVGLPASLAVTPDGARAYVAIVSRFSSGGIAGGFIPATTITVIDLAAGGVSGSISLAGTPAGVAVTADGSRVYVAVPGTSSLAVIDTASAAVVTTIGVAAGPNDVAIVPAPALPGCEDGTPCDDGNACTTSDACLGGFCVGGPRPDCNDDDVCTTDSCNPASGCVHTNNTAPCNDGNACTTGDTCARGSCQTGPPLVCDDDDMCNGLEVCDPQVGCRLSVRTACADAAADVTVYEEARTRNFGADPVLWADARTVKRTYLRFHVTGTGTHPVLGATLRLRVADAIDAPSDSGGRIRRISNCGWTELLMTWNTQPAIDGPVLDVAGPVTSGDVVEFDVTSAILGDGLYCFVTETTSINGVIYDSGETATGPRLTLTLDAACTADIDCDDGIHCTGVETCAAGTCQPGASVDCSNLTDLCNDGVCDEIGATCVRQPRPDGTSCDDGDRCNGLATCDAQTGLCVPGMPVTCNDGNPCTNDSCNPASGCVNTPNTAPCNDGNACTTGDTCARGSCQTGPPLVCDDGDMCNGLEVCDPQTGQCRMTTAVACHDVAADVTVYDEARTRNFGADPALWADARTAKRTFLRFHVTGTGTQPVLGATLHLRVANASDAPSDSGGRIRQISNCSWAELLMTWNTQPAIDGPILDTAGPVTFGDRVEFDVAPAITGDGLYCFVLETTSSNGVIYNSRETATGPQLTLTLDAACTADLDCNDGIHCNGVETCAAGICQPGAPIDCSALTDVCNDGVCDETRATCMRLPRPDGTSCDDGDRCNGLATCDARTGLCVSGTAVPCDDGGACNGLETCDPPTGQCRPGAAIVCNDGNTCNGLETCDPQTGRCLPGTAPACNDGNPCTTDSCTPATGCVHTNNTAPCDDGDKCTTGDRCAGGTCQTGASLGCDDAEMCNGLEACDPQTGQCRVAVAVPDGTPCDDDDLCNGLEACDAASGQCRVSQAVLCEALEADVTVFQITPKTPLGAQSVLWADADSAKHTFIRVSANGVGTAPVVSAVLRLHVATVKDATSDSGGRIHKISDCGWDELTMTWNTRPAIDGPVLDEVGAVAPGDEVEFDITAGISGDGPHCFAIESRSSDGVVYSSRETTAGAPEVEIVLDGP